MLHWQRVRARELTRVAETRSESSATDTWIIYFQFCVCLIINFILHGIARANKHTHTQGVQMKLCKSLMKLLVQRQTTAQHTSTFAHKVAPLEMDRSLHALSAKRMRVSHSLWIFALLCRTKVLCRRNLNSCEHSHAQSLKVAELWVFGAPVLFLVHIVMHTASGKIWNFRWDICSWRWGIGLLVWWGFEEILPPKFALICENFKGKSKDKSFQSGAYDLLY
jgi:hypothetical protein